MKPIRKEKSRVIFWNAADSARSASADRCFACMMLLVLPLIRYGWRVLTVAAGTACMSLLTEVVMSLILHRDVHLNDYDALSVGLSIPMLLPANVPFYVPAIAAVFAIAVVKMPFGGTGHAPFSPTAAGVAFVILAFSPAVFCFASPGTTIPVWNIFTEAEVPVGTSLASLLRSGTNPSFSYWSILIGQTAGPVGSTTVLVLGGCALFLLGQGTARWEIPASFILAAALMAAYRPRVSGTALRSVILELSAGSLLFAALFLMTEYSTAPKLPAARWIYGALGGILTMLFRWYGAYEEGVCFVVLLMNFLAEPLDRLVWYIAERRRLSHGEN